MHKVKLRDLDKSERKTLCSVAKRSDTIGRGRAEVICDKYASYTMDDDLSATVELTSREINSMIITLDEMLFEDIPEKFEDTPSSGLGGQMSNYYEQTAKEGCKKLMYRLKELQR